MPGGISLSPPKDIGAAARRAGEDLLNRSHPFIGPGGMGLWDPRLQPGGEGEGQSILDLVDLGARGTAANRVVDEVAIGGSTGMPADGVAANGRSADGAAGEMPAAETATTTRTFEATVRSQLVTLDGIEVRLVDYVKRERVVYDQLRRGTNCTADSGGLCLSTRIVEILYDKYRLAGPGAG